MLEFYEINELEKKWEEYNKKKKQFSFLTSKNNFAFKFDKTILALLIFISIAIGAIVWILSSNDDEISMAQVNQEIKDKAKQTPNDTQVVVNAENSDNDEVVYPRNDYNLASPNVSAKSTNATTDSARPSLNLNDVGILSSEDSAGFKITNNYSSQSQQNNLPNNEFQNSNNIFNNVPKNEIIDFGNSPMPPKSNVLSQSQPNRAPLSSRIEIKTSNLNLDKQSLESKFYATNKIEYALMLAEEAYNKKQYDNAIKWALTSNEIDKDNVASWIIFAKANYKKGKKDDAIYALETFNAKAKNSEISNLISKIRSGTL